jgi:hypothetical protein
MGPAHRAASGNLVALDDGVLDHDLHVGKGVAEAMEKGDEALLPLQPIAVRILQPVNHDVRSQEAVDGGDVAPVPDVLEPFVKQGHRIVCHDRSSSREARW